MYLGFFPHLKCLIAFVQYEFLKMTTMVEQRQTIILNRYDEWLFKNINSNNVL